MQLPEKLVYQIKVIKPSYPSLILWDMCQKWGLFTNNTIQQVRKTTLFMIFIYSRGHQFLLHLQPLVVATSANARDSMHPYASRHASQTQTLGIESLKWLIWQSYTSTSNMAPEMILTSLLFLTLSKTIEWGIPTSHAVGTTLYGTTFKMLQKGRK